MLAVSLLHAVRDAVSVLHAARDIRGSRPSARSVQCACVRAVGALDAASRRFRLLALLVSVVTPGRRLKSSLFRPVSFPYSSVTL